MDSAGGHLGSSREGGAGRGGVGLIFGLAGEPRPPTAQGRLGSSRRTAWHSAKRKEEEEMFVRNFVNGFDVRAIFTQPDTQSYFQTFISGIRS